MPTRGSSVLHGVPPEVTRALQIDVSDKLARGVAAEGGSQWWLSPTAADREAAAAAAAAGAEQEAEYVRSRTPASQRAARRAPSAAEKPARRAQAVAIVAEAPNAPPSPGSGGIALEWFESGTATGPEIWGEQTAAVHASAAGRGGANAAEEARRSWSELHPSPDGLEGSGTPVLTTSSLGGPGPSSWRRPSTPSTISAARRRSREGSREGLRSWDGGPEAGHDPIDLRPRTPLEAGPDGDGESKKASVNVQIPTAVIAS